MTRDDDYIRDLLFEFEAEKVPRSMAVQHLNMSEDEWKRLHHIEILCDQGFVTATGKGMYRLTGQGHDYIEAIRSDTVWNKTKEGAQKAGGATLGLMKDIAVAYLKQEIAEKTGLSI